MARRAKGSPARNIDVIVIGAGHAGLAFSRCLTESGIDHAVLERGEIANSWRRERWDSLTLLTPNWQCRLPGFGYAGGDPDGFMAMPELIDFLEGYAAHVAAPVRTRTPVASVQADGNRYLVRTDSGAWRCRALVIASGACNLPVLPEAAANVPAGIASLTPHDYRSPRQLDDGGVLVVGASATGLQLADEIQLSGRQVTIATGEHVRMPRSYRGRDILWWMVQAGIMDERYDEIDDLVRARSLPSPQLIGSRERTMLDLNAMTERGVRLAGRLMGFRDGVAQFSGSLRNVCSLADLKLGRMLDTIDEWAASSDEAAGAGPPERFPATRVPEAPPLALDLDRDGIRTIIWATGFRPDYAWLEVPVLDRKGRLKHDGGVVDAPGLYVIGLPVLRRRKSSFIHGAEDDARDLNAHLVQYLRT